MRGSLLASAAFSRPDRADIDVLAATRNGRLAVIELKAD